MSATNDDHTELVKAPGQDGDLLLPRRKPVEVEWPSGNYSLCYVDEGGYRITARDVGVRKPLPWTSGRIVRVLTEDKPAQEPVLPRQIKPEDVRPGMVIETRTAWEVTSRIVNGRFKAVESSGGVNMGRRCEVWLIEDAPEPVDPDAADRQCAWADYRKDYGVGEVEMSAAHKAFMAGWKAAREGDQSGPLR